MIGGVRQYLWVVHFFFLALLAFFLAKVVAVSLERRFHVQKTIGLLESYNVPPIQRDLKSREDYLVIVERNIFDSSDVAPSAAENADGGEDEVPSDGTPVLTSLGIKVLGVLVIGAGTDDRSSATISGTSGNKGSGPTVCAVEEKECIAPSTKMLRVAPDRIEFLHNGRVEYAEFGMNVAGSIFGPPQDGTATAGETVAENTAPAAQSAPAQEGGKFVVDQAEVDSALQNLDRLYTDIRAVPNFSGGAVSGMKILSVKDGSLFSKLGLRRGDVLMRINGTELDVKKGFAIFNQLKDAKNLTVDLTRQGQPVTLDYEIR